MISLPHVKASSLAFTRCYLCDTLTNPGFSLCAFCMHSILHSEVNLNWQDILLRPDACRMLKTRSLSHLYCLFEYQNPLDLMIAQMKYHSSNIAKNSLKQLIQAEPVNPTLISPADCLVPVPLHWFKYYLRGFNQADWLADVLSARLKITRFKGGRRVRFTHQQASLSGQRRIRNLNNAFRIQSQLSIKNKHVLLVDDVVTTGTTLEALAQTFLNAGAARVSAICLCWAKLN